MCSELFRLLEKLCVRVKEIWDVFSFFIIVAFYFSEVILGVFLFLRIRLGLS